MNDTTALLPMRTGEIRIHDAEGFEGMRKAGRIVAECLDMLVGEVKPGVTTKHLDDLVREFVLDHGAQSATIGYRGYRHASCISVNHVICHGIPGAKPLKEGDIANIDVTCILNGWHGDHSRMYGVGEVKRKAERLMDVTYEAMMAGINAVKPGARFGDIGGAISEIARLNRMSVVEDFCGHGLEPMLNLGRKDAAILPDGWTAVTRDRQLSAQFEHSIGVTETGFEVFTSSPKGWHQPYNVDV